MEKKGEPLIVHMRGGTGPGSFHALSKLLQSNVNEFFWPKLSHAISNACSTQLLLHRAPGFGDRFAMADFGCSSALSTINSMKFMAKCFVDQTVSALASPSANALDSPAKQQRQVYIQAFFNDLPGNDFNTLFTLLQSSHEPAPNGFHFIPCGLPGSFYSRLFPPGYLHVGLCTLALHNLSQVPDAIQDRSSPAWNENGVWILEGCKPETAMAYKHQFQKDFACFLRHRSQELVPGGILFCVIIASRADATSTLPTMDHMHLQTNLQVAWRQLVSEGLLDQGSLDAFNLACYMPTMDEVKEVVCGDATLQSVFTVVAVEYVEIERAPLHVWKECGAANAEVWGKTCEMMARNFVGSFVQQHLEPAKFELLMERLRHVAAADDEVYRSNILPLVVLALSRR